MGVNQHPEAEESTLTAHTKRSASQSDHDPADAAKPVHRKVPLPASKSAVQLCSAQHYAQMVQSYTEHPLLPMKAQHHLP